MTRGIDLVPVRLGQQGAEARVGFFECQVDHGMKTMFGETGMKDYEAIYILNGMFVFDTVICFVLVMDWICPRCFRNGRCLTIPSMACC